MKLFYFRLRCCMVRREFKWQFNINKWQILAVIITQASRKELLGWNKKITIAKAPDFFKTAWTESKYVLQQVHSHSATSSSSIKGSKILASWKETAMFWLHIETKSSTYIILWKQKKNHNKHQTTKWLNIMTGQVLEVRQKSISHELELNGAKRMLQSSL